MTKDASLSQIVLSDGATLGFVRAAVIALVIYVIASVAALAARGRWIAGALRAKEIRDELRRLLEEYPHG